VSDITSHPAGTFSWPELSTTDQKGAAAFYRGLFGWNVNDQPMGPDAFYTVFEMRGQAVASAYTMQAEERQHGAPPHWNSYVTVKSADDAAKRAQELGAKTMAPPFDVMDFGRMAILQDPTGAIFQIWEAKKHIGAKLLNEPGALVWSELTTRDTKAAESFYTSLFGWTAKHAAPGSPMEYTEFHNQGKPGVGMMPMPNQVPAQVPSYWMPYFQVTNCDASTDKAKQLGATPIVGPHDIPGTGRFAILTDPQGAMFAIYTSAR
jgi:uncharacterized protein